MKRFHHNNRIFLCIIQICISFTLWCCARHNSADAFLLSDTTRISQQQRQKDNRHNSLSSRTRIRLRESNKDDDDGKNPFDFLMNPYNEKIPKEFKEEIYKAEANTKAAQGRSVRVAAYTIICVICLLIGVTNAALTDLLDPDKLSTVDPEAYPPGQIIPLSQVSPDLSWIDSNPITKILFRSMLGGYASLITAGACYLLAENENDSKRINAEKIWEELEKRRAARKAKGGTTKSLNAQTSTTTTTKPKKKKSRTKTKERKRLAALSEVVLEDNNEIEQELVVVETTTEAEPPEEKKKEGEDGGGGIFGKIKEFYNKADSMAASQALLLNKELEDKGIIDKITDESGLKVIGKEEASKKKKSADEDKKEEN